jgi:hypothetical protein
MNDRTTKNDAPPGARTDPAAGRAPTDPLGRALEKAARSHRGARFRAWCRRLLRGDAGGGRGTLEGEKG